MSKKKGLDIDTQKILAWSKANIVLVILIFVCIGAIVGLPQLGASWTEGVEDSLRQRSKNFSKLESLSKTNVNPPGTIDSQQVAVNQSLVDEYAAIASSLRGDAEKVVEQAVALNQKDYIVLFTEEPSNLFPNPTRSQMETLPQQYVQQLESNYKSILESVGAGSPVSMNDLVSYLEDARVRFMETNLSTKHDANLTPEQRSILEKHLTKLRMGRLRSNAKDISVYLEELQLGIPLFDHKSIPTVDVLFAWQWRYWVVADAIGAVGAINGDQSVLTAPIKRIISVNLAGLPSLEDDAFGGDDDRGGRGGFIPPPDGGFGEPGGGRGGPIGGGSPRGGPIGGPIGGGSPRGGPIGGGNQGGGSAGGGSKPPTDNGAPADSFTGRNSGGMYDLVKIRIRMIVDTERIPIILDGFSKHNFLTVIDLDLRPEDKFTALADGYDYGPASVSELTVVFESAWLRSWTTTFMPDGIKKLLGIKVDEKN